MKNLLKYFSAFIAIGIIAGSIYGITHPRSILDYIALYNYTPPAEVTQLADVTTMQDGTRRVFYVNKPELQDKTNFRNSCIKQEETIVLGCYVENSGIYLLKVEDPRLEGIIEVTSAHEVLHAMYDRLSDDERREVDAMTEKFFGSLSNDRIKRNIENYRKRDSSVVPNELHSILATEVRDLSPELENYYKKYFIDRKAVVALSEQYESKFVELERQVQSYKEQLEQLKATLEDNGKQVDGTGAQLDTERKRLDQLLAENKVEEYNASVPGFNTLVNQYNSLIQNRRSLINQYNSVVELYNEVATTEAELVESLQVTPVETQESR